jgi:serine/threonine protein kinase
MNSKILEKIKDGDELIKIFSNFKDFELIGVGTTCRVIKAKYSNTNEFYAIKIGFDIGLLLELDFLLERKFQNEFNKLDPYLISPIKSYVYGCNKIVPNKVLTLLIKIGFIRNAIIYCDDCETFKLRSDLVINVLPLLDKNFKKSIECICVQNTNFEQVFNVYICQLTWQLAILFKVYGVFHGDIKEENILCSKNEYNIPKSKAFNNLFIKEMQFFSSHLIDFGLHSSEAIIPIYYRTFGVPNRLDYDKDVFLTTFSSLDCIYYLLHNDSYYDISVEKRLYMLPIRSYASDLWALGSTLIDTLFNLFLREQDIDINSEVYQKIHFVILKNLYSKDLNELKMLTEEEIPLNCPNHGYTYANTVLHTLIFCIINENLGNGFLPELIKPNISCEIFISETKEYIMKEKDFLFYRTGPLYDFIKKHESKFKNFSIIFPSMKIMKLNDLFKLFHSFLKNRFSSDFLQVITLFLKWFPEQRIVSENPFKPHKITLLTNKNLFKTKSFLFSLYNPKGGLNFDEGTKIPNQDLEHNKLILDINFFSLPYFSKFIINNKDLQKK